MPGRTLDHPTGTDIACVQQHGTQDNQMIIPCAHGSDLNVRPKTFPKSFKDYETSCAYISAVRTNNRFQLSTVPCDFTYLKLFHSC